ncbi:sialate:O-sulfotransferase 1-like [Ptychodera flava]|uniref:sialate:O-sulfotransferase 1-like n=1 Tax=Ptychodera flava TaxID=63121 RepID=UPI003969D5AD
MVRRDHVMAGLAIILLVIVMVPLFTKYNVNTKTREGQTVNWNGGEDDLSSISCPVRLASPNTFPLVPLISPGGAGNTWTRHLIEQATGFYTGSVYHEKALYEGGFVGEFEDFLDGNTLTVKVHCTACIPETWEAAILLLRNPIDAAISERNRRRSRNHVGKATWRKRLGTNKGHYRLFIEARFKEYESIVKNVLDLHIPTLVVHYENIKENSIKEVKRIVNFLNMTMNE